MKHLFIACSIALLASLSFAQSSSAPVLPYSPSLDVTSMDKTVDPCVDLYTYSCGGWQ
jgi:endothelin-converting enzyme/putative endopeptidase